MPKTFQIPVISGGRLITSLSTSMVGPADYVSKINFRRDRDQEIRREGYLDFEPLEVFASQNVFDATETCIRQVELQRGNGDKVLVGFGRTLIKQFVVATGTWETIGSGYDAAGKRWQVVTINGTLVANNAVDLPIYWNIGDAAVTPMYELREVGVVRVGRITENNGFLIIADITDIRANLLEAFMRGWSDFAIIGNNVEVANFSILEADTEEEFLVTTGATDITATLPAANPAPGGYDIWFVWITRLPGSGAGAVVTSPVIIDMEVNLVDDGDTALVWWDKQLQQYSAVYFPGGVIPADAPYGTPPVNITQRVPWAVANSEYGIPNRWAPVFTCYQEVASTTIALPFPSTVFIPNQTRIAVIGAGPLGGILGGQEETPNGVLVQAVSDNVLGLEVSTDPDITYPRFVQVVRWEDVSSLVGRYDLQGDNSEITSLATLREWLIVARTTGIYKGRFTGDPDAPFVFTPAYAGSNVPLWPDAIANIKGDYLLYPARGERMYAYDGVNPPIVHEVTDQAAPLFFTGYDQDDEIFWAESEITKEALFFFPDKTLAFDFDTPGGTLSVIDQHFDAAAMVHRPGSTDFWFIMSIGRFVYTYGLCYGVDPFVTWLRDGVAVESTILYGLWSANNQAQEKLLTVLTPIFSSQSLDTAMEVELGTTHNPNAAVVQQLVPPESLPTPSGRNCVACAFQAIYFQTRLTIVDERDRDARLSMLVLEAELVGGFGGITRSVN